MLDYLFDILWQAITATLESYGQTWKTLLLAALPAVVYWCIRHRGAGWRGPLMLPDGWRQTMREIAISLLPSVIIMTLVFGWDVLSAAYERDASKEQAAESLKKRIADLEQSNSDKDKRIQFLQDQRFTQPQSVELKIPPIEVQSRPEEKREEVFNKTNWIRLRFEKNGGDDTYYAEVTLEEEPVPSSLLVIQNGMQQLYPGQVDVKGRVIRFWTPDSEFKRVIRVRYYPKIKGF